MDINLKGLEEGVLTNKIAEIVANKILVMKDQIKKEIVNQISAELYKELHDSPELESRINEIINKADKAIQGRVNKQITELL